MAKYHINSRGVPSICRAKNHCPLGSSFEGRAEASLAAENEKKEFMKEEYNKYNEMKEKYDEILEEGNLSKIEERLSNANSASLENVYSQIRDERNEPGSYAQKQKAITEISNQTFKEKKERAAEIRVTMTEDLSKIKEKEQEVERLEGVIKKQEESVKNHNEGTCPKCGKGNMVLKNGKNGEFVACNKFPACKHTDKPVRVNPNTIEKLRLAKNSVQIANQQLDKKVEEIQKEDKKSIALNKTLDECNKKRAILDYIDSYENPRGNKAYLKSSVTPIEKQYEERKAAEESIEKKIGTARIAVNSRGLKFGENELKDKLTVDSKGKINNLYIENPGNPGDVKKVVAIHGDASGNVELEDGTKFTISNYSNYKRDGLAEVPEGFKFYVTNSKSKKEYSGYKKLIVNNFDSGD